MVNLSVYLTGRNAGPFSESAKTTPESYGFCPIVALSTMKSSNQGGASYHRITKLLRNCLLSYIVRVALSFIDNYKKGFLLQ